MAVQANYLDLKQNNYINDVYVGHTLINIKDVRIQRGDNLLDMF